MKLKFFILAMLVTIGNANCQESPSSKQTFPITITIFSESVGIPNFRNLIRGGLGIRVGTELYYRKKESHQLLQTINLGYYCHKNFQEGIFINSEFGYRKFFEKAFADATVGAGYLIINSALPRYESQGDKFVRSPSTFGRLMPTLGLGAGYQFKNLSLFSRYEMFGEMPFGFKGLPALPHRTLHLGTRVKLTN